MYAKIPHCLPVSQRGVKVTIGTQISELREKCMNKAIRRSEEEKGDVPL